MVDEALKEEKIREMTETLRRADPEKVARLISRQIEELAEAHAVIELVDQYLHHEDPGWYPDRDWMVQLRDYVRKTNRWLDEQQGGTNG